MRTGRMSSLALSCAVAVLVVGAMAAAQTPIARNGFNSTEDPPYFTPGDLGGQGGSTNGWAGPWVSSHSGGSDPTGRYLVVAGGSPASTTCSYDSPGDPDQHLKMFGSSSSGYMTQRPMDDWSGDFIFQYDIKLTLDGGLQGGGQIQLEDTK